MVPSARNLVESTRLQRPYRYLCDGLYYGGTIYNATFVPWVVGARLDDINLPSAWQPDPSVLAKWVKASQTARLQLSSVHAPKSGFNYPKRQRRSSAAYSGHASVRSFEAPDSLRMSLVPIFPRKSTDSYQRSNRYIERRNRTNIGCSGRRQGSISR
jgi:hypothetical protein